MNINELISGEANTWDGDYTVPTLNGYKIFYGEPAREIWGDVEQYSDEGIALFQAWCKAHNIAYWAAPREDFFSWKGAEHAREQGATYLILEDLS